MSRWYSTNPAIWLVPRVGSILPIRPAHSGQYPEKYFEVFLEAFLNHLFFIFICIALVLSTIYSLINCSIYGESCCNEVFLEAFLNHLFFIFICIALVLSTIYSLINCSIYGESCCNNSPLSFRFFSQPFVRF